MELRTIGNTHIQVTPVAMGCWPIAGITSIDVNEPQSLATLDQLSGGRLDVGIEILHAHREPPEAELPERLELLQRRHARVDLDRLLDVGGEGERRGIGLADRGAAVTAAAQAAGQADQRPGPG